MQELKIASRNGILVLSDVNTSSVNGGYRPFTLVGFDPVSATTRKDTVECVDMNGQHTISSNFNARPVTFTVKFSGEYRASSGSMLGGGVEQMYRYRREIITMMPANEILEVSYYNGIDIYYLNARLIEIPVFNAFGSLCSVTFMLVADYPFWFQNRLGNIYTATTNSPSIVNVRTEGDIESPIIGTITCVNKIAGSSASGEYFRINRQGTVPLRMSFIKNLEAGEKIIFNSGFNNEVWVRLVKPDGTEILANNYVWYRDSALITNNIGETRWQLTVYGTSGELTIQMQYQNLYLGV